MHKYYQRVNIKVPDSRETVGVVPAGTKLAFHKSCTSEEVGSSAVDATLKDTVTWETSQSAKEVDIANKHHAYHQSTIHTYRRQARICDGEVEDFRGAHVKNDGHIR